MDSTTVKWCQFTTFDCIRPFDRGPIVHQECEIRVVHLKKWEKSHIKIVKLKFEVEKLLEILEKKQTKTVLSCLVICTTWELIYIVNLQSLLFCAKKYGPGWMGGRAGFRFAYSNQK